MNNFKPIIYLFFIVCNVVCTGSINAQSCLPKGIEFTTQQQIDDFSNNYPGCTDIEGDVTVKGANIMNLNGLIQIKSILGNLTLIRLHVDDLSGLDSLQFVGGSLHIEDWYESFITLNGLNKLTTINGDLRIITSTVKSLSELENLNNIGGAIVLDRCPLDDLSGLENIIHIDNITIQSTNISSMTGLENLSSVDRLSIRHNTKLTSLSQLDNLSAIGDDLEIEYNNNLPNLTGLENITSVGGKLKIVNNGLLKNMTGLNNLTNISKELIIYSDPQLTSASRTK